MSEQDGLGRSLVVFAAIVFRFLAMEAVFQIIYLCTLHKYEHFTIHAMIEVYCTNNMCFEKQFI